MSLCSHRIPFFWSVGSRISSFSQRLLCGRALPHNVLFPRHYSVVGLHSSSAIDCAAFWSTTLSDPVCISSSFSARPHALWLPSLFTGALISSWDLLLFGLEMSGYLPRQSQPCIAARTVVLCCAREGFCMLQISMCVALLWVFFFALRSGEERPKRIVKRCFGGIFEVSVVAERSQNYSRCNRKCSC